MSKYVCVACDLSYLLVARRWRRPSESVGSDQRALRVRHERASSERAVLRVVGRSPLFDSIPRVRQMDVNEALRGEDRLVIRNQM